MRVNKQKVTLLSAALAAVFASGAAHAAVNYQAAAPTGVVPMARELIPTAGAVTLTQTAALELNVSFQLGFGASSGQNRYLRLDLPPGVNFVAAPTATVVGSSNIQSVNGGAGSSFVILQVTSDAGGMSGTNVCTVTIPSITFTGSAAPANITMRVVNYEFAANAVGQTNALATPVNSAAYVTFVQSYTLTPAISAQRLAQASSNFTQFCLAAGCSTLGADNVAPIGQIALANATFAAPAFFATTALSTTFVAVNLATIFSAGATISLAGNFPTAGGAIRLESGATCAGVTVGGSVAAISTTGTSATITLPVASVTAIGGAGPQYVCYTPGGTFAMNDTDFAHTFTPVAVVGVNVVASALGNLGSIRREGVTLQSPWFTFGSAGTISRFFLTNSSASAVTCAIRAYGEAGNALTQDLTTVTLPANGGATGSMTQVTAFSSGAGTGIISAWTGSPRAAVNFVCIAPTNVIQGTYVLTNSTGSSVSTGTLLRPGTN